ARGEFVLVYDGDGREAETDLTIASEFVTPAVIRALRKEAGGLICMTVSGQVQARIGLPFMTDVLRRAGPAYPVLEAVSAEDFKYDRHSAFSIAVNHRDTFTGVTDVDRAKTISRLAAMATGVFDLLHPGHLYFLREARKLGDELWVVVARDRTARRFKHEPITPEDSRLQLVEALKPVDRAVLGHEGNIYDILDEIRPDVIAIGFDQVHDEDRILEECRKRGLSTKVVRLPKFEGDLDG